VRTNLEQSGPFIAIAGLVVALFLYAYSAIALASWLHTIVLPVVWLVLFAFACAWFNRRPQACIALAACAFAVWFGVMVGLGPAA
jgi:hypothetical protein